MTKLKRHDYSNDTLYITLFDLLRKIMKQIRRKTAQSRVARGTWSERLRKETLDKDVSSWHLILSNLVQGRKILKNLRFAHFIIKIVLLTYRHYTIIYLEMKVYRGIPKRSWLFYPRQATPCIQWSQVCFYIRWSNFYRSRIISKPQRKSGSMFLSSTFIKFLEHGIFNTDKNKSM